MNKSEEDHLRIKFRELFTELIKDAPKEFMVYWDRTINIANFQPNRELQFTLNGSSFSLLPEEMQDEANRLFRITCKQILGKR